MENHLEKCIDFNRKEGCDGDLNPEWLVYYIDQTFPKLSDIEKTEKINEMWNKFQTIDCCGKYRLHLMTFPFIGIETVG